MQGSQETSYINAPQAVEEHEYAAVEDDYISVTGDDCQDNQNQLEGENLTPIHSYHQDHQERAQTPIRCYHQDHQERGQVSIKLPCEVPQRRSCKQPPWWAWMLTGIGIGVLVLLFIAIMTGIMKPSPVVMMPGPKDCLQVYGNAAHTSGVYRISPDGETQLDVFCEQRLDGGGWLVFQARKDGSVDFYQNWNTYKAGFGNLTGEFWLGNDKIHLLTKQHDQQLKIQLTSPEGEVEYADYSQFWIDDEANEYKLYVSGYSGGSPPGDSLAFHSGYNFSTSDHDNDNWSSGSCATEWHGAWWYRSCGRSNLNGRFGVRDLTGMLWTHWKSSCMKATRMMVRRRP